jgi:hypothetical protein
VDEPQLTRLITDLTDVNPDRAFNITAPFFKGLTFLRYIEENVGGEGNQAFKMMSDSLF